MEPINFGDDKKGNHTLSAEPEETTGSHENYLFQRGVHKSAIRLKLRRLVSRLGQDQGGGRVERSATESGEGWKMKTAN